MKVWEFADISPHVKIGESRMSGMPAGGQGELSEAAQIEGRLASTLRQTSQELARLESLDPEQRAEV